MQPEARQQFNDHVAEGCGGEHVGEIGPRECSEVAGKKADKQQDAKGNPGSEDSRNERKGMIERDSRHAGHTER